MSLPAPPFEIRLAGLTLQAMKRTLAAAFADRENAPALCQELLARPEEARLAALAEDETFASPGLGHALLDRAEALFRPHAEGPHEALHLCALAVAIGERLSKPWTGLERDSLLGRARSLEGEAHRQAISPPPGGHSAKASAISKPCPPAAPSAPTSAATWPACEETRGGTTRP